MERSKRGSEKDQRSEKASLVRRFWGMCECSVWYRKFWSWRPLSALKSMNVISRIALEIAPRRLILPL